MACCSSVESNNNGIKDAEQIHKETQQYYGEELQGTKDLKTTACTTKDRPAEHVAAALKNVHDEVMRRFYGCGLIAPECLEGLRVVDLGSGSGRDVYVLSQLVGEERGGEVVGVDMTREQLEIARSYEEWHRERFGFAKSNVRFVEGYLERLDEVPELREQRGTFDLIVSNCVLNLCTDKDAVLRHAFALLKEGGEFYFSDVYADRRVPAELQNDPVLYGECLSGALYWNDFVNMAKRAGFGDPRLVTSRPIAVTNKKLAAKTAPIRFFSATYRLFKLADLEPACEEYGQAVRYKGTIPNCPHHFALDSGHVFDKGLIVPVCGNSASMLANTRFAPHFDFFGDRSVHYGIFPGGKYTPFNSSDAKSQETSPKPSSGGCC